MASHQPNTRAGQSGSRKQPSQPVASSRRAVLLLNLGTPDAPDRASVRRYLSEFLSDPYVIKLRPRMRWFTPVLGRLIALFRAKRSAHAYKTIWWKQGSPLKVITEHQVQSLQRELGPDFRVCYAMRYGSPGIRETVAKLFDDGVQELIVLPMYAQYSGPTTGTAMEEVYAQLAVTDRPVSLHVVGQWYDDPGYIESQARLIDHFTAERGLTPDNAYLLFSAHSMPESYIEQGDPYQEQIKRTVALVRERLGWREDRCAISYQSKLGPVKWLSPSTVKSLKALAEAGETNVVVCPISFTADCLETLEEIGVVATAQFEHSGGTLHLCSAPNDEPGFIKALAQIVRRGPKKIAACSAKQRPLLLDRKITDDAMVDVDNLVMVGASLSGRLDPSPSSSNNFVDRDTFNVIKRSTAETTRLLQDIHGSAALVESFVWNTCCRYELYGWFPPNADESTRQETVDSLLERLTPAGVDPDSLYVLRGRDALSHLLQTASGFGSVLPGDADVMDQLAASVGIAKGCLAAGNRADRLLAEVDRTVTSVREQTKWGEHCHHYVHIALNQLASRVLTPWQNARIALVGGSTTTRAVLRVLVDHYKVPQANISVVYRGGNRRNTVREIRRIAPQSRRLLVDEYVGHDIETLISDTDIVVLGIDRKEPILDATNPACIRNFIDRPLTIIDFNSFGSSTGFDRLPGVALLPCSEIDEAVSNFANKVVRTREFHVAREAAEVRLDEIVNGFLKGKGSCAANGGKAHRHTIEVANA